MEIKIRDMRPEDMDGKAYVHWKSWQETYSGHVDEGYLAQLTLTEFQERTHKWPHNIIVAELDGRIVGFSRYGAFDIDPLPRHGEIIALYVLKEAQGLGIGRMLMDTAIKKLSDYREIHLWVLKGNDRAIGFYEHYGFRFDGVAKAARMGTPNTELRMVYQQKPHLSIDFDLFYSRLCDIEYQWMINETNFYLENDPVYDSCWLGRLDGPTPYWYGLTADGSQAYDYATAQELVDAKVFHGKSLCEVWDQVRFYSIGNIDPDTWLARYG